MSDLSAKLSHLEALRKGAAFPPWALREDQAYSWPSWKLLSRVGNCLHAGGTFPEKADAEFIVDLVNASPWLIPLAQQAEKLAEAVQRDGNLLDYSDVLEAALAEFEAIKKEAEDAPS